MTKRQTFTKEFKLEAVRLLNEGKKAGTDLARELGIKRNQLYKWKEEIELNRDFSAQRLNQKWVSDVTFIPTREGWLYLATVMDLFSRKIIGWSMGSSNSTALISQALLMAIPQRDNIKGVILHSDRGIQYASRDYQNIMREHGIVCSMSRKGNCWVNAVMESFITH